MKYLLLSLGLLLSGMAQAQTTTPPCAALNGYVFAGDKPIAGVTVTVKNTRLLTITNSEGFYTIPGGTVEQPTLQFSAAGYEPESLTVTTCTDAHIELQLLPGTRIKQRGKRKGFIMKTGSAVQ